MIGKLIHLSIPERDTVIRHAYVRGWEPAEEPEPSGCRPPRRQPLPRGRHQAARRPLDTDAPPSSRTVHRKETLISTAPTLTCISLGTGVQSSAMLALSARGVLPKVDYAIFADTGWEPRSVYQHLDRLEREIAQPAGIPILRVSSGNIRDDALDPHHRFASMPLYVLNQDGRPGMTRRQCTVICTSSPR